VSPKQLVDRPSGLASARSLRAPRMVRSRFEALAGALIHAGSILIYVYGGEIRASPGVRQRSSPSSFPARDGLHLTALSIGLRA